MSWAVLFAGCTCVPNTGSDGGAGGGAATGGGTTTGGGDGSSVGGGDGSSVGGGAGGSGGGDAQSGDDAGCGLVTCASAHATCGLIGDGCGAVLECGSCTLPETCGGGGVPSQCGGDAGCVPVTCAQLGAQCGPMSDRCGGLLDCGTCTGQATCGGGGIPGRCGYSGTNLSDAGACIPRTCAAVDAGCGVVGDGCGGVTPSCGTCSGPQSCGGGGVPYQCGTGQASCVPRTCASVDAGCGVVGDGCGGLTPSCGTCSGPQSCGGGGVAYQCGTGQGPCVPRTAAELQVNCGPMSNGCGSLVDAGSTCPSGQTCGGGGQANVCGGPPACVPKTCGQLGVECGLMGDGCGGLIDSGTIGGCGTCTLPEVCGGGGAPSMCGQNVFDAGACVNLCTHQQTCPGTDGGTTLSGRVVAPTQADAGYGQPDPIPGALVYIPNGTVEPLNADGGVSCDLCSDGVTGSPLVSTYTKTDGTFTLTNVPCGAGVQVPVVIQLGKWRRQVTVSAPTCCAANTMTQEQTRLPRKQGEGHPNDNIPRIAIATGDADTIECVLPKIGIATTEYSLPGGTGRVRFYKDNGEDFAGGAPAAATLFDNLDEMRKYDMIILDCVGKEQLKTVPRRLNMEAYANAGGRIFASHFAYVWLFGYANSSTNHRISHSISFTDTASWYSGTRIDPPDQDAFIDNSFTKGLTFADWVGLVGAGASSSPPKISINTVRYNLDAVSPSTAQQWVYGSLDGSGNPPLKPFQYTFNTPVGAQPANQCGRVLFSDFHVVNASNAGSVTWPQACGTPAPMTPQEKVFEYLIFDLSSCIRGDDTPISTCTPTTCNAHGFNCGWIGDGCGGALNCGTCTGSSTCGGGGHPNLCGTPACTPRTCQQLGATCGVQGDGCGGSLPCGNCVAPQTCGGGGTPNVCGGGTCPAKTCLGLGFNCGAQGDGCGNVIQCGSCPTGETCGGAGVPGVCGAATCTGLTCTEQGIHCGPAGDGCGNVMQCGDCPTGQTCGGAGVPGMCGAATCTGLTCAEQGIHCGPAGDGCGNVIQCGGCPTGQSCGGGGVAGECGTPACVARTCASTGADCGALADGCGGVLDCGTCTPGYTCGGSGVPNVCGGIG